MVVVLIAVFMLALVLVFSMQVIIRVKQKGNWSGFKDDHLKPFYTSMGLGSTNRKRKTNDHQLNNSTACKKINYGNFHEQEGLITTQTNSNNTQKINPINYSSSINNDQQNRYIPVNFDISQVSTTNTMESKSLLRNTVNLLHEEIISEETSEENLLKLFRDFHPNQKNDDNGETALMLAIRYNKPTKIINCLILNHARPDIIDKNGTTILEQCVLSEGCYSLDNFHYLLFNFSSVCSLIVVKVIVIVGNC